MSNEVKENINPTDKNKNKTGVKIKCIYCGYVWLTQSQMMYVTCSNCKKSVKQDENRFADDEK